MINLVPSDAKKNITVEYWLRVSSAWAYLWSVTLVVAVFVTIPVYVLINIQVTALEDSARSAEETVTNYKTVSKELIDSSRQAVLVINSRDKDLMHEYVSLLSRVQGSDVVINQMTLARSEEGIGPILLSGQADNREALAAFRDNLLAEAVVSEVDLPISNLAKDKDISFSLSITLNNGVDI